LKHVKEHHYTNHHARTIVKRPSSQNLRRYGSRHCWQQVADRPIRDMKTVVLDSKQKMQILADINEYLHPATPRWYANRGIPLRRGYLFYGPPGTGKTSLSFALAGVFGLDIYVISLLEPTLTEEDLSALFTGLPRRCIVLLEDIDTAGLKRPDDEIMSNKTATGEESTAATTTRAAAATTTHGKRKAAEKEAQGDWKITDLAKALKDNKTGDEKKGISLSGLLNAIDGVASHEGRVLIMTTNAPESLDEALIRPGRVDLQVGFTNATQAQAEELFVRMYEADQGRERHASGGGGHHAHLDAEKQQEQQQHQANGHGGINGHAAADGNGHVQTNGYTDGSSSESDLLLMGPSPETASALRTGDLDIAVDELPDVAAKFAAKIPGGKFSPAEIQGYLLKRKKHPLRALDEADKWVEAMLLQKASKSKVMQVQ
jgi:mitochondrial chaperone BCS1